MGTIRGKEEQRFINVFGLLVALGVLLLGFIMALNYNQGQALKEARAKLVEEQSALGLARKRLAELKKLQQQAPEIKARLAVYQQALPSGSQEDDIIIFMVQWAENSNLRLMEIRFQEHVPRQGYQEIPVLVTLEGYYHEFLQLLKELQQSPRVLRVDQIKVEQIDEVTGQIKVELTVSAFYL